MKTTVVLSQSLGFVLIFAAFSSSTPGATRETPNASASKEQILGEQSCANFPQAEMILNESVIDVSPFIWSFHGQLRIVDERPPCAIWRRDDSKCMTALNATHPFLLAEPLTIIKTVCPPPPVGQNCLRLSGKLVAAKLMFFVDGKICSEDETPEKAKWQNLNLVVKFEEMTWENVRSVSNGVPIPIPNKQVVEQALQQPFVGLVETALHEKTIKVVKKNVGFIYIFGLDSLS